MQTKSIGQLIANAREEKNYSQRTLATLSELTNSTISRIEAGIVKPDHDTITKIAKALDVDKEILMSKSGHSDIPEEFIVMARKTGDVTEEQRAQIYDALNKTIDDVLSKIKKGEK